MPPSFALMAKKHQMKDAETLIKIRDMEKGDVVKMLMHQSDELFITEYALAEARFSLKMCWTVYIPCIVIGAAVLIAGAWLL